MTYAIDAMMYTRLQKTLANGKTRTCFAMQLFGAACFDCGLVMQICTTRGDQPTHSGSAAAVASISIFWPWDPSGVYYNNLPCNYGVLQQAQLVSHFYHRGTLRSNKNAGTTFWSWLFLGTTRSATIKMQAIGNRMRAANGAWLLPAYICNATQHDHVPAQVGTN